MMSRFRISEKGILSKNVFAGSEREGEKMGKHRDMSRFHDMECTVSRKRHAEESDEDGDLDGFLTNGSDSEEDSEDGSSSSGEDTSSDEALTPPLPVHPKAPRKTLRRGSDKASRIPLSGPKRDRVLQSDSGDETEEDHVLGLSGTSRALDEELEMDGILHGMYPPSPAGNEEDEDGTASEGGSDLCQDEGEVCPFPPYADLLLGAWNLGPLSAEERQEAQKVCDVDSIVDSISPQGAEHVARDVLFPLFKRDTTEKHGFAMAEGPATTFVQSNQITEEMHSVLFRALDASLPGLPKDHFLAVRPERDCEATWMHAIRRDIAREPGSFTERGHPVLFESAMVRTELREVPVEDK